MHMKTTLLGTSLILGSFVSAPVLSDVYFSAGGGIANPGDVSAEQVVGLIKFDYESKNSGIFALGLGKKFDDKRIEFNFSKSTFESDKFDTSVLGIPLGSNTISPAVEQSVSSYMVYGIKDFLSDSKFTPYAGLGLGFTSLSSDTKAVSVSGEDGYYVTGVDESVFSFGLKGGISYDIADNTALFTEASYLKVGSYDVPDPITIGITKAEIKSNNIVSLIAGLRFSF